KKGNAKSTKKKGLSAKPLLKSKSNKPAKSPVTKVTKVAAKPSGSGGMIWTFIGFLICAGSLIGLWFAKKENRKDKMGFNFMESDSNRGANSQAFVALDSHPSTGISQAGSRATPQAGNLGQAYDPR